MRFLTPPKEALWRFLILMFLGWVLIEAPPSCSSPCHESPRGEEACPAMADE
jgi:hypothetical protein